MKSVLSWRDSASLILVAKNVFQQSKVKQNFNYKLLTLKRSAKSSFMPGTHVFPGGNCDKSDSIPDWFDMYKYYGIDEDQLMRIRFFSHRITAIRETFEETGVLICRSSTVNYGEASTPWASIIGGAEVQKWQERVHEDSNEFMTLCCEFKVYPDVWALKEWSNWLTPPSFPARFNAIFFLAAFQEPPAVQAEEKEVQMLEWNTPLELLLKNRNEELILPPPQFYETSRLLNFGKIEDLAEFAHKRPKFIEAFLPHRVATDEGTYSIYPGDDLYPKPLDISDTNVPTLKELPKSNVHHRTLHQTLYNNQVIVSNYKPKYGQVLPLDFNQSKL